MVDQKIKEWVQLALKDEDIHDFSVITNGTTDKADGYLGDIFFITAAGKTKNGKNETIDLVIKASKDSITLREQTPVRESFEKEIFIYDRVLPSFKKLQEEKGASGLLDYIPLCYATKVVDNSEILVLEDLKSQNYSTCDKKKAMTFEHVELVLQAYGKWHAFSFALRKEKPELFAELTKNNVNMLCYWFETTKMIDLLLDIFEKARDGCISSDNEEILNAVNFSINDANYIFKGLFDEDPDYRIISHGDCWNGNFMFKYDNDNLKPVGVQVLDWQCAGLSSPVMDLSHFLYACCNTGEHKDISEMLKIYYDSFSKCLESLHLVPEELFSYAKLVEHWKRFSQYGILLQGFALKFTLCDPNDAPDFVEAAEGGKEFLDNFNIEISNKEVFYKRVKDNLLHYVKSLKLSETVGVI